jgi:hypothetical protein
MADIWKMGRKDVNSWLSAQGRSSFHKSSDLIKEK